VIIPLVALFNLGGRHTGYLDRQHGRLHHPLLRDVVRNGIL
jgi:hypothetical protein